MSRFTITLALISMFILGILVTNVYSLSLQQPMSYTSQERFSPSNWIKQNQIHVYDDKIVIDIANATWTAYADTNSMDPLIDISSNGLEIVPEKQEDLKRGDVISYESEYVNGLIIHRIVEINEDEQGWYVTTKGDNNYYNDPEKIRFDKIKYVLIGILY